jgi:hypothetical protein
MDVVVIVVVVVVVVVVFNLEGYQLWESRRRSNQGGGALTP